MTTIKKKIQSHKLHLAEANQRDGEAELKALQQLQDETAIETVYPLYFHSSRYAGKANAEKRIEFFNKPDNSLVEGQLLK